MKKNYIYNICRHFLVACLILNIPSGIHSQEEPAGQEGQPGQVSPEQPREQPPAPPPAPPPEPAGEENQIFPAGLNGFAEINWGTSYRDAKERFRVLSSNQDVEEPVDIISDSPGESILIKRGGIHYMFLFYSKKDPPGIDSSNILQKQDDEDTKREAANMARFFFVSSSLPFVPSQKLYEKLKVKYGDHTSSGADKTRGAYVWDIENGILVQWVESYRGKPYSRSIYYIAKEIREEIMKDLDAYQNYKELKAVENLIP